MYINSNKTEKTGLLVDAIIEAQKDEYTFLKTTMVINVDGLLIPYETTLRKYLDYIKANSFLVKFTDEEKIKYMYNPKRLSYDLYNTTRLFFILLYINNMKSKIEFDRDTILVPKPGILKDCIEKIKIKEQDVVDINREKNGL